MKLYLAGPMTGLPNFNYDAFAEAARVLRDRGYEVLNPAEHFGGDQHLDRENYLRKAIATVVYDAQVVVLLDGWETSQGAVLEARIAQELRKPVVTYQNVLVGQTWEPVEFRIVPSAFSVPVKEPRPESVLAEAATIVGGDRRRDYGHPAANFRRIADNWRAPLEGEVKRYLESFDPTTRVQRVLDALEETGFPRVSSRTVGNMMIGLKLARDAFTPKHDNLVDTAGYAEATYLATEAA